MHKTLLLTGAMLAPAMVSLPASAATLVCPASETYMQVTAGDIDNFVSGGPAVAPRPSFVTRQNLTPANTYDGSAVNNQFGDSLTVPVPANKTVKRAWLSLRLKGLGDLQSNDAVTVEWTGVGLPTSGPGRDAASFWFKDFAGAGGWTAANSPQTLILKLRPNNTLPAPAPQYAPTPSSATLLSYLTTYKILDVYVQDDTSVDYIQLEYCVR